MSTCSSAISSFNLIPVLIRSIVLKPWYCFSEISVPAQNLKCFKKYQNLPPSKTKEWTLDSLRKKLSLDLNHSTAWGLVISTTPTFLPLYDISWMELSPCDRNQKSKRYHTKENVKRKEVEQYHNMYLYVIRWGFQAFHCF